MTVEMSYDELLMQLQCPAAPGIAGGPFEVAQRPAWFIPPRLVRREHTEGSGVLLVSARGATGKSTLGQAISAALQVPLWRLDEDKSVSADALASRLREFSPDAPELVGTVVIDALDEARVRVSALSWHEFANSLAQAAKRGVQFVLLGRDRVVEDLFVMVDDLGASSSLLELSHFGPVERVAYVDVRCDGHRDIKQPQYLKARDLVLTALAGSVDSTISDAFAGYAPVLDAVVALLRGKNLDPVVKRFSTLQERERVAVLRDVIERLLEREQAKVTKLDAQLGLGNPNLYDADEQLDWLISDLMGASQPALTWCPSDRRTEYVKQIGEFLRDHPFRANDRWASPVFSAYTLATRFAVSAVRGQLVAVGTATGLLHDFVTFGEDELMVDELQFAALHHSLLAGEWPSVQVSVELAGDDAGASDLIGGQLLVAADDVPIQQTTLQLVLRTVGHLDLLGPLASVSVGYPGIVHIGRQDAALALGPDCFIRCDALDVRAQSLEILRRPPATDTWQEEEEASVVLEVAHDFPNHVALAGAPPSHVLEVRLPQNEPLTYPWVDFRQDSEPPSVEPADRAVRFLNMFMVLVRRHGHGGQAMVFDKKLEGRQSLKGEDFARALDELTAHGVVVYTPPMIKLAPSWEQHRYSGKGRPGQPGLADKRDVWDSVLSDISSHLR